MKTCLLCTLPKALEEFYDSTNKGHKDGKNPYCKQCCKVNRGLEAVRQRDRESKVSYRQLYRARVELKHTTYDTDIELVEVFRKALGICHICGTWVMPSKASMDHKNPLSKGGLHVWGNIGLTHIKCNLVKGDRV